MASCRPQGQQLQEALAGSAKRGTIAVHLEEGAPRQVLVAEEEGFVEEVQKQAATIDATPNDSTLLNAAAAEI